MQENTPVVILLALLKDSLEFKGMKDENGRPIAKYAFLKKKHLRKLAWQKCYQLEDGRNFYVRVWR